MEAGKASRSAMGSGLLRAAHVREDAPPWVFEDTLARRMLSPAEVAELEAPMAAWPPVVRRAFRVSHAVRARLAEDVAVAGLAAGRRDYVLLGAGLDTFAWRHPRAGEFIVWEVDHPATQAWKRAALRRAGLPEPANVRFVPADLASTAIGLLRSRTTPPGTGWASPCTCGPRQPPPPCGPSPRAAPGRPRRELPAARRRARRAGTRGTGPHRGDGRGHR